MMLPLFTRQVIHVGPTQLGAMFSAIGVGAVFGALITASLGDFARKGLLVLGSVLLFAAALALFGLSGSVLAGVPLLFILGAAQNTAGATTITLLQTRVPSWMRGRAMSLNTLLIMSIRPLGDFPVGAMIGRLGFRPAVLLSAVVVGVVPLALLLTQSVVRADRTPLSRNPQLFHQNLRVPSALVVFLAAVRRKIIRCTFGKAALRLEVSERLRR